MIILDGSHGEGGGQILRSALALSAVTETPFRIENIRANRRRPGLMRQHVVAVEAAATISGAQVSGAELHSKTLEFHPQLVRGGLFRFDIGSAGSATLVLQTILPALMGASQNSRVHIEGGTHNPMAPPFDSFASSFLPLIQRMGPLIEPRLARHGFYPAGGGLIEVSVRPSDGLMPLRLEERGAVQRVIARAIVQNLPRHIADREIAIAKELLTFEDVEEEIVEVEGHGPGNGFLVEIISENVSEVFSAVGSRGVRAEAVAASAVKEANAYLKSGAPVGEHLADQLLLPIAMARAGSFVTQMISSHFRTNIDIINHFLPAHFEILEEGRMRHRVVLQP